MNLSTDCLRPDQVRSMLDGDLPPMDAAAVEEHLSACDECRRRLDLAAGDPDWWDERTDRSAP